MLYPKQVAVNSHKTAVLKSINKEKEPPLGIRSLKAREVMGLVGDVAAGVAA